ncbi:unnamed protein product [Angiostrongylus costaricensis]|uniref:SNF2_N domain-containing protein n=1 Tax=Angiostrongylus costaricensis TaxID=334426 RepID=A0A0R3PS76_ANGCS|nr:unnamed protein product [Angiostrongylus costaricensis]
MIELFDHGRCGLDKAGEEFEKAQKWVIVTPRRRFQLLSIDKTTNLHRSLKSVEVLVVDKAERFDESQFEIP